MEAIDTTITIDRQFDLFEGGKLEKIRAFELRVGDIILHYGQNRRVQKIQNDQFVLTDFREDGRRNHRLNQAIGIRSQELVLRYLRPEEILNGSRW